MSPKKTAPKKTAKKPAKKPTKAASQHDPQGLMTPPATGVKVRMYRTGLGDCFLLAFPRESQSTDPLDRVFYVLIDCGVYFGTSGGADRIRTIAENIKLATGNRLDLLVITHEHWDHVSGFHKKQAQDIFESITLGGLWMAWTENLKLRLARDLHGARRTARNALLKSMAQMQSLAASADRELSGGEKMVAELLSFFGGPAEEPAPGLQAAAPQAFGAAEFGFKKSVQTEEAMEWLRKEYGGEEKTTFLHPCDGPLTFDGVPDARVYVLGPPEDPDLIKRADPLGDEVYHKGLAAAIQASFFAAFGVVPEQPDALPSDEDAEEARRMSLPFDEFLQLGRKDAEDDARTAPKEREAGKKMTPGQFFRDHYFEGADWRQIEGDWLEAAGEFALQLDNATNNTSLAFAIEVGPPGEGKVLLFPGDAQVGNWLSWFGKVKLREREVGREMVWTVDGGRKVTAEDLLRRTVLYKVGHHGSHNATLREKGLEMMGKPDGSGEFVALLPVDEHVAREKAGYGEMPLRSLMKELAIRTRGRIIRNDEGAKPKDKLSTLAPIPGAPALVPSKEFVDTSNELYFEYTIPS